MDHPNKIPTFLKIGLAVFLLLVILVIYFIYATCVRTTERVFTRENTALEMLPEEVPIPLMSDGKRVDYVRAYELIYPGFRADDDGNALRDVVRFMGPALFLWEKYDDRLPLGEAEELPPRLSLDEMMEQFAKDRFTLAHCRAYCKVLALDAEALPPYAGLEHAAPPVGEIALAKLAQWRETRADAKDTSSLPDDLRTELEDEKNEQQAFLNYYGSRFHRPWTAAEFPEMAEWLTSHAGLFDVFTAAARRDVFVLPFYRSHEQAQQITMNNYDVQFFRCVARMLTWRANLAITDADAARALSDAETLWRLGRHITRQPNTLIAQLVGSALQGMAQDVTLSLLTANICTPEELVSLAVMLDALPAEAAIMDVFTVENWSAQEFVDILPAEGFNGKDGMSQRPFGLPSGTVDPNYLADHYAFLRKELEKCTATGDYDKINEIIDRIEKRAPWKQAVSILTVRGRSELMAELLFCLMTPAWSQYHLARDRSDRGLELARLTVALKRYKAEHSAYPETLDALVPAYLPALPAMPDTETYPLTYYRKDAGFILAAVEKNFDPESEGKEAESDFNYRFVVKPTE